MKNRFYKVIANAFHNSQFGYIEQIWLYFWRLFYIIAPIVFVLGVIVGYLISK